MPKPHTVITAATALLRVLSGAAHAGPSCQVSADKWMPEAQFRSKLESQGCQLKTFKVSKGQCYEIYGFDTAGHRVEICFDPATAAVLEAE